MAPMHLYPEFWSTNKNQERKDEAFGLVDCQPRSHEYGI